MLNQPNLSKSATGLYLLYRCYESTRNFPLLYVTMLYESGIDPLVAMRIVGHADYQTTANIYTHLKDETLRRAYISMEKVFGENRD